MPTTLQRLPDSDGRSVWLGGTTRPYEFVSPFAGKEFALLLFVADPKVTVVEQVALSDAIVAAGCRYAVCAGEDCSSWDDSIDFASVAVELESGGDCDVMTTWHEDEDLAEVAWYLLWVAKYEGFLPRRYLAWVVGGDDLDLRRASEALKLAAASS